MYILITGNITQDIVNEALQWVTTPEMQAIKAHISVPVRSEDGTFSNDAFIRITGFFREPGEVEIEIPPALVQARDSGQINIEIAGTAVEPVKVDARNVGICLHPSPQYVRGSGKYILFSCPGSNNNAPTWAYFECNDGNCRLFRHKLYIEGNKIKYRCEELFSGDFETFIRQFVDVKTLVFQIWAAKINMYEYGKSIGKYQVE